MELLKLYINRLVRFFSIGRELEKIKLLQGTLLAQQIPLRLPKLIAHPHLAEFSVFSQWGDDGIIQFLTQYVSIKHKTFVEFGVENYREANTRFLLLHDNWRGLVMDGSTKQMQEVQRDEISWKYNLTTTPAFVTKDNINTLLQEHGMQGDIGLLHIDIDGNDYWVWQAITVVQPIIVIVEYNSVFGPKHPWVIPYRHDFFRLAAHYSGLYWGASLTSLCDLAKEKGYIFVTSNSNGNNAYFVRRDHAKKLRALTPMTGYVESQYAESIDRQGNLTYIRGANRLKLLSGMPIYNTRKKKLETITP